MSDPPGIPDLATLHRYPSTHVADNIAIISDLHLTSDRRYSEFTHEDAEFADFLDDLEAAHELIYVVGDIYNLHHARLPGALGQRTELAAARRRFPMTTRRLSRPPYRRVFGNHDGLLAELEGVPSILVEEHNGKRIVITHGHQFDGVIKQLPVIAPVGAWLEAWVRRAGLSPIGDALVELGRRANKLDPRRPPGGAASLIGSNWHLHCARSLLDQHQADIVILGHTHAPLIHRFDDGKLYVNGGSCSFGVWTWASLRPATVECTLHSRDATRTKNAAMV